MEWRNEDGVNPEKLTKEQLIKEISSIGDFATMGDCMTYLSQTDPEAVADIMETMITADQNSRNYGDAFYQAMFLGDLFSLRPEKAIEFTLANYDKVELYVLKEMVENITYVEGEEYNEVRNVLKTYLEGKSEGFFKDLELTINGETYKNTTREEFLKSFENDDQPAT